MKKLILSVVLATCAVAIQAGGDCCAAKQQTSTTKDNAGCSAKVQTSVQGGACCADKVQTPTQTKTECPFAKLAKKNTNKQVVSKQALLSPKATADAGK